MDITFYCQKCNHKIDATQFGALYSGRCPECDSMEGFSTLPKDQHDPFTGTTVVNDAELLKKTNGIK